MIGVVRWVGTPRGGGFERTLAWGLLFQWDFPVFLNVLSRVRLLATTWTVALQAPLSRGFPRQDYWNMLTISYSRGSFQPRDRTWVSCVCCSGRRSLYQVCYLCSIESSPERKFSSAIIWKRPKPSPCPSEGAGQLLGPKQRCSACVESSTHLPPQTCERCHPSRQKWKAAETTVTTRLSSGCRKIWAMAEAQRLPREIPVWRCRWYAI